MYQVNLLENDVNAAKTLLPPIIEALKIDTIGNNPPPFQMKGGGGIGKYEQIYSKKYPASPLTHLGESRQATFRSSQDDKMTQPMGAILASF